MTKETSNTIVVLGQLIWSALQDKPVEEKNLIYNELNRVIAALNTAESERALWEEGCRRNEECYKAAVRKQDEQRLEILELTKERDEARAACAEMRPLLEEMRRWHGDKNSPGYNECDKDLCHWCELVTHALSPNCGTELLAERERYRKALGMETEWPLHDVLDQLVLGIEHLLHIHNCDHEGHEQFAWCIKLARQYEAQLREALNPKGVA